MVLLERYNNFYRSSANEKLFATRLEFKPFFKQEV